MQISMGLYVFIAIKAVDRKKQKKVKKPKNNHSFSKPGCNLRQRLIRTVVNTIRITDTFS